MLVRPKTLQRFHNSINAAALQGDQLSYVLHNAVDHFLAVGAADLASQWSLRPTTIFQRLECSEARSRRWIFQVDALRKLSPHAELDTLSSVLCTTTDWLEESPKGRLEKFVQGLFEISLHSTLAGKIREELPSFPERLFAWCHPPVWQAHTGAESPVSFRSILKCKQDPEGWSWGICDDQYLVGYDNANHAWVCFDIITNTEQKWELADIRALKASPGYKPLDAPITAKGGDWGTVVIDGISVELCFGKIEVLAQSEDQLLAWSDRLYLVRAEGGWAACGGAAKKFRLYQRQLLPSLVGPEGELECGIVIGDSFLYIARNSGVSGDDSTFTAQFWELMETGLKAVDVHLFEDSWVSPQSEEEETFNYEHPAEEAEVRVTRVDGATQLAVTVYDDYYRPHGCLHRTTRPVAVAGSAKTEGFHDLFCATFAPSYGDDGEGEYDPEEWDIEGTTADAYLNAADASFEERYRGMSREQVFELITETWKCDRFYESLLVGENFFVFFEDDFNALQLKWGSDFQ